MRGCLGISKQYDVLVAPTFAENTVEVEPCRSTQVTRVRHQLVTAEITGKDFLASRDRLVDVHPIEAGASPSLFRAFDNEGRRVGIELIGVHPNPAVLGLFENEGECIVEFLMRSEPDVFAGANIDVRLECVCISRTDTGIHAIRADNDVEVLVAVDGTGLRLEFDLHAERTRTILQNVEKPLAADTAEAMAARPQHHAAIVNGDVIPINKRVAN